MTRSTSNSIFLNNFCLTFNGTDLNVCIIKISYSMAIDSYGCVMIFFKKDENKFSTQFFPSCVHVSSSTCKIILHFVAFFAILNFFFFVFIKNQYPPSRTLFDFWCRTKDIKTFISIKFSFQIYTYGSR